MVNVVDVGVVITWNNLSSKSELVYPVPTGKVTLSNKTISPIFKPWDVAVVIVQDVKVSNVVIVADEIVVAKGVMSYNWPSKYISKNLSVPNATYLFPDISTKACCFLTTPTID